MVFKRLYAGLFVSILYYHRLCVVLSAQCIVFVSPLYCVFTWIIKYLYLDCIVFVSEWIKLASRMRSACASTGCGRSRPRLFAFHIRPCVFSTCCIWYFGVFFGLLYPIFRISLSIWAEAQCLITVLLCRSRPTACLFAHHIKGEDCWFLSWNVSIFWKPLIQKSS